jgi:hypothetical protein
VHINDGGNMDEIAVLRSELTQLRAQFVAAEARAARRRRWATWSGLAFAATIVLTAASWPSAQPGVTSFKTPFLVTDKYGKTIFAVMDELPNAAFGKRGALVLSSDGQIVAAMLAGPGGGIIKVAKGEDPLTFAGISASDKGLGFRVKNANKITVDLSEKSSLVNAPFEVRDAGGQTVFQTNDKAP